MAIDSARGVAGPDGVEQHSGGTLMRGRLPPEEFALQETFSAVPDLTVEWAPSVATGNTADSVSLLWADTDDPDLTAALTADSTVATVEKLHRIEDRQLYHVEWTPEVHCCLHILLQSRGVLLSTRGTNSQWAVEILYPNREDVQAAIECCEQYGLSVTIDTIRSPDSDRMTQCGLTPPQYETLTQACQHGYFDVPREIGLEELADTMNVSHQALSERLRRGHDTLIRATLLETASTLPTISSSPPVSL